MHVCMYDREGKKRRREEVKKREQVTNICEKMSRVFQFSVVP